jgi:hypothetical protein
MDMTIYVYNVFWAEFYAKHYVYLMLKLKAGYPYSHL